MHSQPIPPQVKSRNKKLVIGLVSVVIVFTVLSLMYLAHYGANFQRHGFH
ncbi:MAG: hypothetical protein H6508_01230 [Calditrichaeota bacterium]|nr:hypothetical protein [Calditrichota bacterium]MCB9365799.1 hypothetical protein [Calditrichota bacterium]